MAKGQMRPNKEKRKPKKEKDKKAPVAQPRFSTTPVQVGSGSSSAKKA